MLKSIAPVKIPDFVPNKSSLSWEQVKWGGWHSYQPLWSGPRCVFGLVMGKRMFLDVHKGACQEAMGSTSAALDGSMWWCRGSWAPAATQSWSSPCTSGPDGASPSAMPFPGAAGISPGPVGQGTKGIPPELGHLAILVLVQTVWNAHHSPELTGTVTNEAKMAGMTFPC